MKERVHEDQGVKALSPQKPDLIDVEQYHNLEHGRDPQGQNLIIDPEHDP